MIKNSINVERSFIKLKFDQKIRLVRIMSAESKINKLVGNDTKLAKSSIK